MFRVARLEAQARLIAACEERKWPRRPPSIADLIRHLMDQHGLTRADMVPILGTPSRVSEVLHGKKGQSMAMVQRLGARLHVPADLLLSRPKNRRPGAGENERQPDCGFGVAPPKTKFDSIGGWRSSARQVYRISVCAVSTLNTKGMNDDVVERFLILPRANMIRHKAMVAIGLGFRALKGGGVVVGVAANGSDPRVVLSTFLATAAEGERLALEPYRVAAEMEQVLQGAVLAEAAAAVAEGRQRQGELAAKGLDNIVRKLREAGCEPAVAALLVNRAGWITDLLEYSLSWPEHVPVAEGLAVRDALRFAFGRVGVDVAELDEKSLPDLASKDLAMSLADLNASLKALGAAVGQPWRKEQKLACLAAWVAVAARR
jgi:antitoxin component HigA of HigAB toxin-antitoxin module